MISLSFTYFTMRKKERKKEGKKKEERKKERSAISLYSNTSQLTLTQS